MVFSFQFLFEIEKLHGGKEGRRRVEVQMRDKRRTMIKMEIRNYNLKVCFSSSFSFYVALHTHIFDLPPTTVTPPFFIPHFSPFSTSLSSFHNSRAVVVSDQCLPQKYKANDTNHIVKFQERLFLSPSGKPAYASAYTLSFEQGCTHLPIIYV